MQTINGMGTTLYGREYLPNSYYYIATQWFVIFWVPIFPIRSYIIISETDSSYTALNSYSKSYTLRKTKLNIKQVIFIYFFEYLIMSILVLLVTEKIWIFIASLLFTFGLGYFYLWLRYGAYSNIIQAIKSIKIFK